MTPLESPLREAFCNVLKLSLILAGPVEALCARASRLNRTDLIGAE
jgi:hypothetical protein